MFPFTLSLKEVHKIKYIVNIAIHHHFPGYYDVNIVKFKEGGCIDLIHDEYTTTLNIMIPTKPGSNLLCNFWCNSSYECTYKNLRTLNHICGPWIYIEHETYREQRCLDLHRDDLVDYEYLLSSMISILSGIFCIIRTGWTYSDEEMDGPLFRTFMDTLDSFEYCIHNTIKTQIAHGILIYKTVKKMRSISKQIKLKCTWDNWMNHWLDPDNSNGYIRLLKNKYVS
jgi:hypothetical protein